MATTLEILAPYLPYGIEVKAADDNQGRLVGLNHGRFQSPVELDIPELDYGNHLGGLCYYPYDMVLPVLRPLNIDTLRQRMADCTIPALAIAQVLIGQSYNWQDFELAFPESGHAFITEGVENLHILFYTLNENKDILSYGRVVIGPLCDTGVLRVRLYGLDHHPNSPFLVSDEVLAYLYKHHFAVGLEPSQFIPKQ
jgi:hypothetical protein